MGVLLAVVASAGGIEGQVGTAPDSATAPPRTVTARVRHVTVVVLPTTTTIVDVVAGDSEYWDVTYGAHMAFLRPLMEGAESNVVILTAGGEVIPLLVVERGDRPVEGVVRIGTEVEGGGRPLPAPVLAPVGAVVAAERDAAEAWAAVAEAEARAAERIEAVRAGAVVDIDALRELYPRRLQFDYRWVGEVDARSDPWLVEGMWNDGERTFVRSRARELALFEWVDDELVPVSVASVVGGVVHVVPRVLGDGALDVRGEQLWWTVTVRERGP